MNLLLKLPKLFTARERAQAAVLLVGMLGGACLEAFGIGLIMPFIALLSDPEAVVSRPALAWAYRHAPVSSVREFTLLFGGALLVAYVVKNAYLAILAYVQYRFIHGRELSISTRLLEAYLSEPYPYFLSENTSILQRNINQDVSVAFSQVLIPIAFITIEASVTVAILSVLVWFEPVPTIVAVFVLGGATALLYRLLRARLLASGGRAQESRGAMVQWVNQALGSIKETKILGRESFFVDRFASSGRRYIREMRFYRTVNDMPRLFIETIAVAGMLFVGSIALLQGGSFNSLLPMLGLFALAAVRLMPSLNRMVTSMTTIRHSIHSFDVVYDGVRALQDRRKKTPPPSRDSRAIASFERIELKDVSFAYGASEMAALSRISLTIRRGQSVAVVGASGAGKTTLVDILLGLLTPSSGQILIDGVDMESTLSAWQRAIGYVPQTIYLIDDSIRRNVAFGVSEERISDTRLRAALRAAHLSDFVDKLPDGVETRIGENGHRLSGGERQRIGIARALYEDPPILVMDEATSALDGETESEIKAAIALLSRQKTLIIIAHRLSTVRECDVLFFLSGGGVADSGTYDQLIASSDEFRKMVDAGASRPRSVTPSPPVRDT